jgi:small subunit ribosomal protein S16
MLTIRLRRIGKKNKPTYRLVAAEHSQPVNGKFIADLGYYNPHTKETGLKVEEIKRLLNNGAKPSNTAAKILEREKIKHSSIVVIKKSKKSKNAADEAASEQGTKSEQAAVETPEAPAEEVVAEESAEQPADESSSEATSEEDAS